MCDYYVLQVHLLEIRILFMRDRIMKKFAATVFIATILLSLPIAHGQIPCPYTLPGDINNDCVVNLVDISILAINWLVDCDDVPLNRNCIKVSESALILHQKSQLRSIEIGLEVFRNARYNYPPSFENAYLEDSGGNSLGLHPYSGANKLAEAMMGMDMLGFHPHSSFKADACVCSSITGTIVYNAADQKNIDDREECFLDFERSNVYMMRDVYQTGIQQIDTSLVLCDVFEKLRPSGKMTGMPILYYRADRLSLTQDFADAMGTEDDVFDYYDNKVLLDLGAMLSGEETALEHPLAAPAPAGLEIFEQMILNPQIFEMTGYKRPYNHDSFILISAGPDGLYGTEDDITNFDKSN